MPLSECTERFGRAFHDHAVFHQEQQEVTAVDRYLPYLRGHSALWNFVLVDAEFAPAF